MRYVNISENLRFDVLLLSKVYYVWAKKNTEELCVTTQKNDAKFEKQMTCALKNDMRNLVNFNRARKNIKISTMRDVFVQGI